MIRIPPSITHTYTLVWFEYVDPVDNTLKRLRYTDADRIVVINSGENAGTYYPDHPIVVLQKTNAQSKRIQRRPFSAEFSDPAGFFYSLLLENWKNKRCVILSLLLPVDPDGGIRQERTGYLKMRRKVTPEGKGRRLILEFGGLMDSFGTTKKRQMNAQSQRDATGDDDEDSLDHAQRTVDENWGGNA